MSYILVPPGRERGFYLLSGIDERLLLGRCFSIAIQFVTRTVSAKGRLPASRGSFIGDSTDARPPTCRVMVELVNTLLVLLIIFNECTFGLGAANTSAGEEECDHLTGLRHIM